MNNQELATEIIEALSLTANETNLEIVMAILDENRTVNPDTPKPPKSDDK